MKKIISIFLLISVLVITACSGTRQQPEDSESAVGTAGTGVSETEYSPDIEAVDYNGAELNFLTRSVTENYIRQTDDISAEEENGNALNDEIFRRNSRVMEKYNLVFNITVQNEIGSIIKKSVGAGDDQFDIIFNGINENTAIAAQGYLMDLNKIPHVDISRNYWNRPIMEDMSVYGKYYLGISNLNIQAYFSSGIYYFNKQLAADYGIEDPYRLVRSGQWTFDRMVELCRDVSLDLNGNGIFDENDRYGMTYNNFAWQIMFYGIGETFVTRDTEGQLEFNNQNQRIIDFVQKMMPVSLDNNVVLYSENYKNLGGEYRITVCQNAFNEGRVLFWLEAMYGVPSLRDMERDFGIIPSPKYDEAQDSYYSFIHTTHGSSVIIPQTVSDTDRCGRILEEITYQSGSVRNAFIETTLKGKYARDNDSGDMIDIIIKNIRTDYALLLNLSGLSIDSDMRKLMDKGSSDIVSLYASNLDKYSGILEKYNGQMKEFQ